MPELVYLNNTGDAMGEEEFVNISIPRKLVNEIMGNKGSECGSECHLRGLREHISRQINNSPPAKQPTAKQQLDFLYYAHLIKETERRGWILQDLKGTEAVASHMYRMALMCALFTPSHLNTQRCMELSLIHDLAESIVGDITPDCGVSPEEKWRREDEAMEKIVGCLGDSLQAAKVKDLWLEYSNSSSQEAIFVHEIDKLEFAIQTMEYEHKFNVILDGFIKSADSKIQTASLRELMEQVKKIRQSNNQK